MSVPMVRPRKRGEVRTPEQLWEQYQIEKELARSLREASRENRRTLYANAYNELFRRVPHHSQLTKKASGEQALTAAANRLLPRFLSRNTTFLEIGAGDCALSFAIAERVRYVYAIDVSDEITRASHTPANFQLILSDGSSIPVPAGSVDVAYSNQLMEHLHPEDAEEQLKNIFDTLAPGGVYICLTPNRLTGPHDISRYFDSTATGMHLREYTMGELLQMMRKVGFRRIDQYLRARGKFLSAPTLLGRACEGALSALPEATRRSLANYNAIRSLVDIRLVARK